MSDRYAPPRTEPRLDARIKALRAKGWSDKSIARHLGVPIDAVHGELGITTYTPDGRPRLLMVEVVK